MKLPNFINILSVCMSCVAVASTAQVRRTLRSTLASRYIARNRERGMELCSDY